MGFGWRVELLPRVEPSTLRMGTDWAAKLSHLSMKTVYCYEVPARCPSTSPFSAPSAKKNTSEMFSTSSKPRRPAGHGHPNRYWLLGTSFRPIPFRSPWCQEGISSKGTETDKSTSTPNLEAASTHRMKANSAWNVKHPVIYYEHDMKFKRVLFDLVIIQNHPSKKTHK